MYTFVHLNTNKRKTPRHCHTWTKSQDVAYANILYIYILSADCNTPKNWPTFPSCGADCTEQWCVVKHKTSVTPKWTFSEEPKRNWSLLRHTFALALALNVVTLSLGALLGPGSRGAFYKSLTIVWLSDRQLKIPRGCLWGETLTPSGAQCIIDCRGLLL